MRTRDKRKLMKDRKREKTPEEQEGLKRILTDLQLLRAEAINRVAPLPP